MAYYGTYSNQAQVAAANTIAHLQALTLTGSGFGTKSRAIAPLVYDVGAAAVNTLDSQWDAANSLPNALTGDNNIQLQNVGYGLGPAAWVPGAPSPFVPKIYAGCHQSFFSVSGNAANNVQLCKSFTRPTTYPFGFWCMVNMAWDPNWVPDPLSDNNIKDCMWSDASTPQPGNGNFFYHNWPAIAPQAVNNISQATSAVVTFNAAQGGNPVGVGKWILFAGIPGMTQINGLYGLVTATGGSNPHWTATVNINSTGFSAYSAPTYNISAITQANPGNVTLSTVSGSHPLSGGPLQFNVSGVSGMSQINGSPGAWYFAKNLGGASGAWTFDLCYYAGGTVDTSGYSAYTSGGVIQVGGTASPNGTANQVTGQYGTDAVDELMWDTPDGNGHNARFWNQALYPINPANAWIAREWEMGVTTSTGLGGLGFFNTYDNRSLIMFYAGRTCTASSPTPCCFNIGDYARDRSNDNFRAYGGPIVMDFSNNGTPYVARIMAGDQPTLSACTFLEYVYPTAWSNTSVSGTFWKGKFVSGQSAYFYVYTESGTQVASGSRVVI